MQVACGGRGPGVAVPSGGWAVSSAIVVVAFGGDGAGVDPGPVEGRAGRPRNRRLCVGRVPRGPLSGGDLSVLGGEDVGVTVGETSASWGGGAASLLA